MFCEIHPGKPYIFRNLCFIVLIYLFNLWSVANRRTSQIINSTVWEARWVKINSWNMHLNNLSLSPSFIPACEDTGLEPFLVICEQPRAKDSTKPSQHLIYTMTLLHTMTFWKNSLKKNILQTTVNILKRRDNIGKGGGHVFVHIL